MLIELLQVIILKILLHIQLGRNHLRMQGLKYELVVQLPDTELLQPRHPVHQLVLPLADRLAPLVQLGALARLQQRADIRDRDQTAREHASVARLGPTKIIYFSVKSSRTMTSIERGMHPAGIS